MNTTLWSRSLGPTDHSVSTHHIRIALCSFDQSVTQDTHTGVTPTFREGTGGRSGIEQRLKVQSDSYASIGFTRAQQMESGQVTMVRLLNSGMAKSTGRARECHRCFETGQLVLGTMQKTKYTVDYPLKQKCQRFLRTQTRPQHLIASEANTQKILEKKKKTCHQKI